MNMKPILRKCLAAMTLASALFAASCQKETESPTTMTLAVNDNTINLTPNSGKEHVLVYAKGQWNADFKEAVEWAAIEEGSGTGNGEFILTYKKNPDILRRAEILLTAAGVDKTITITVNQEGEKGTPKLAFAENEKSYIAWEVKDAIAVESNINQSLIKAESSVEWIGSLELKDGQLSFTVAENTTGEARKGTLTVSYTDIDESVYRAVAEITQGAEPGHLALNETEMAIEAFAGTKTAPWDCVLGTFMPELTSSVTYEGSQKDWISNVTTTTEALSFDVTDNETKEARTAVIKVELASKGIAVELKVTQGVKTRQYSFEELRAVLPSAGEQAFEGDFFEGVIVADAGQKNMETNPMTSATSYDDNESAITNYVQSLDGKYGMRLKFATAADNTLKKGDKVKISLAGATLVREDNPVRYTLRGVSANSVTVEENVQLTARQKTIAELTDEDVYTLVTLPDVEVPFCYGSWVNVRKEWIDAKRINFDNRILRDVNGNEIRMIVNTDAEWYLTDAGVPKGSGPVSGVIVNTTSEYYGSDILGKYQIRPMKLSDIEIKDNGFSEILVAWDYSTGFSRVSSLEATTGTGTFAASSMAQANTFLQFRHTSPYPKGYPKGANIDKSVWWKDGAAKDAATFQFSTKDAAGKKMTLSFGALIGNYKEEAASQGPVHWNVEYSLDGTNYILIEKVMIRPMGAEKSTLLFLPASLDDQCVELPDAIAGHDNVTIRFIAADDATVDFSKKDYSAKVVDGCNSRLVIGPIAVKYNK